jgi:uncharacterized protein YxjI
MKKVFIILATACLSLGLVATLEDGDGVFLFVGILFAAFFGFLAWIWRGKSPVQRAGEQVAGAIDTGRKRRKEYKGMSGAVKRRYWKYRIMGALITLIGVWSMTKGYGSAVTLSIATVILIVGIAVWNMAAPDNYNSMTDMGAMIAMDRPRKIEEFYEAYKTVKTPLGSGYLGRFYTMKQEALIFGPDSRGQYIYFWLTKDGNIGYIGYSFLENMIKEKINVPLIPAQEDFGTNTQEYLCYHSDLLLMQRRLKESLEHYIKTGQVLPIEESDPSEVYTFTEDFKLTGQHFELRDKDGNMVYEIDGTAPLIRFFIYDKYHNEVFKVTKEVGHALATYRFYYRGEPYGTLEKQFVLVKDKFVMDIKEGRLELTEYAGSIGHNFCVTLNGRMLGAIMDDLDINLGNIVFDNAVIIAYDEQYLPLLTAMAVMVARELARDEEGGLTNWD